MTTGSQTKNLQDKGIMDIKFYLCAAASIAKEKEDKAAS